MKKHLIALTLTALCASAVQATTIYEQEGSKLSIGGWVGVRLVNAKAQRTTLENHASNVDFSIKHQLGNGYSALAYFRLKTKQLKDSGQIELFTEYLYAGIEKEGVGTLTLGTQRTNGFSAKAGDYTWLTGENNNVTGGGKQVIKLRSANLNGWVFGTDYIFRDLKENNTGKKYGYDFYLGYSKKVTDELNLGGRVAYSFDKNNLKRDDQIIEQTQQSWRVAFTLGYNDFSAAANYGETYQTPQLGDKTKKTYVMIATKYRLAKPTALYAQYLRGTVKTPNKTDSTSNIYSLGIEHKLHKNVVTWLEGARYLRNDKENDRKIGAGFRVLF